MDSILSPLISVVVDKAADSQIKQFCQTHGMDKNRKKLHCQLLAIQKKITDAEDCRVDDPVVQKWMKEQRAALQNVADMLDEFQYEALRQNVISEQPSAFTKVIKSFFTHENPVLFCLQMRKMRNRLTKLLGQIDDIVTDMNKFNFVRYNPVLTIDRETQSFVMETKVIGRMREKEKILHAILDLQYMRDNFSVLPIVGIGGLGKTTLAQLVYNDKRVSWHFDLRMWVFVSNNFNVVNIIKSIIEVATNTKVISTSNKELLQHRLREILYSRRYLLVLDDVWNENKEKWDDLKTLLTSGENSGSAIIVTTRNKEVASIMGTLPSHHLVSLNEEDSWQLFAYKAFGERGGELPEELTEYGKIIVRKCAGIPVALKAMGDLMRSKREVHEWHDVAKNKTWEREQSANGIFPALKLSYDELPSYSKQCFAFCAIFPQDYNIERETLIQLWMANDFIPTDETMDLEMRGRCIFNELYSRSFFQDINEKETNNGLIITCKMHDLMHDLATQIAGKKCSTTLELNNPVIGREDVQHLLIPRDNSLGVNNVLKQFPFFLTYLIDGYQTPEKHYKLLKSSSLRALQFRLDFPPPKELGYMKHMRYLDLSWGKFSTLPETISQLYNLQTLKLSHSSISKLPECMRYMSNLRHLFLDGCDDLKRMPIGLGQLRYLRTLTNYVADSGVGRTIGELNNLKLYGHLCLSGLARVKDRDAVAANLAAKINLYSLELEWDPTTDEGTTENNQVVLEALTHHNELKYLAIKGYGGYRSPKWMMKSLKKLVIMNCRKFTGSSQTPRGEDSLPRLEILLIRDCPELVEVPRCSKSLKELQIIDCPKLSREGLVKLINLTELKKLEIITCTNLRALPDGMEHLTSLEELSIVSCPRIESFPEGLQKRLFTLQHLHIEGCPALERRCGPGGDYWHLVSSIPNAPDFLHGGPMSSGGDGGHKPSASIIGGGHSFTTTDSMLLASEIETGLLPKDKPDIRPGSIAPKFETEWSVNEPNIISGFLSDPPQRAPRLGFCTEGEVCVVRSNHFRIQVNAPKLYKYSMVLSPHVKSRGLNRAIMAELVEKDFFGEKLPAFDGNSNFYTAQALSFESKDFSVMLRGQQEFKGTIKLVDLVELTKIQDSCFQTKAVKALDAVLRESPSLNYTAVSGSFFSLYLGERTDIGDSLECWRGYRQSLHLAQMGPLLNIDALTAPFYKPVNVAKFAMDYLKIHKKPRVDDEGYQKLQRVLVGIRVEVTHRNMELLQYNIVGLTTTESPSNPMELYNYELRYTDLPHLICFEDKNRRVLPMEVCNIIEGQKFSEMLKKKQMKALLRAARQRPYHRLINIGQVVQYSNLLMEKFADQFKIRVENQAVKLDARVLPAPTLKYHDTGEEKTCVPCVGQWNMTGKKVVHGGTVQNWACLSFKRLDIVDKFCEDVVKMCKSIGMVMESRPSMDIQYYKFGGIVEEDLRRIYSGFQGLDLLIVILPEEYASLIYKYTKTVCETQLGIVSQCCSMKNFDKASKRYPETSKRYLEIRKRYLENVALKINVKVGGFNTELEKPLSPSLGGLDCATIIFGIDVNHPTPGDVSPSIAAVVASMGWPTISKYRTAISAQQPRKEIIVYGGMIRELLIGYMREQNVLPQRIIIYRGGVSEGQFSNVLLHELSAIRQACQSLQKGYEPRVTFVVLQKGHHTRLFPEKHSEDNMIVKSGNILPGTVVDKGICHPTEFDFYLCSHAVLQGTSRPTHYHVLFDEIGFSANELQVMTNNLCYTYSRCTRSVSIVPPVYYAHLVAARARCYIETRALSSLGEGSSTGTKQEFKKGPEFEPIPTVKENLKDVMFYC